jgi:hypothetical protein
MINYQAKEYCQCYSTAIQDRGNLPNLSDSLSLILLSLLTVQTTGASVFDSVLVLLRIDVKVRLTRIVAISFPEECRIGAVQWFMLVSLRSSSCLKAVIAVRFSKVCGVLGVQWRVSVALYSLSCFESIVRVCFAQERRIPSVQSFWRRPVDFSI